MAHTSGPWGVEVVGPHIILFADDDAGLELAEFKNDALDHGRISFQDALDSAILASAAPCMLAALQACLPFLESEFGRYGEQEPERKAVEMARAAIVDATERHDVSK